MVYVDEVQDYLLLHHDTWLGTWANDQLYVIVQAALSDAALNRTLIDVHAGGAYGAQPSSLLFQTLTTATWRFDFGGPWARVTPDSTVNYGWRSRLPSELFGEANLGDAFGFVMGMVDAFGAAADALSSTPSFADTPMVAKLRFVIPPIRESRAR